MEQWRVMRFLWGGILMASSCLISCHDSRGKVDSDIVFPESDLSVESEVSPDLDLDYSATEEGVRVLMREHLLFTNGAGVAVSIDDRRVDWRIAIAEGKNNVTQETELVPAHLFRIASITKMFVAAAVLRLSEQQKIHLEDPLAKWYPAYPEADRITIRMLLNHTSGISDYNQPGEPEDIIAASADMPRYFEPGEGWAYSNTNYVLLGRIVEKVSGTSLGAYLKKEIFDKGEFVATSLEKEDGLLGTLAEGHLYANDSLEPYTGGNPAWADGGIAAPVSDIAHFAVRLFNGWILSTTSLDQMLTFVPAGDDLSYGLGVLLYDDPIAGEGYGHNGSVTNYNGEVVYFPKIKIAVAIQENYPIVSDNEFFRREIVRLVMRTDVPPLIDECFLPDFITTTGQPPYETVRFKGRINDIEDSLPEAGAGYFYFSEGLGIDNLFCGEYVFYDEEGGALHFIEECPEVERYYTGPIKVRRFNFSLPLASLKPLAGQEQTEFEVADGAASRFDYWYDLGSQRVIKRCFAALEDGEKEVAVSVCPQRNIAFGVGEEVRLFARIPLTSDIPDEQRCICYDAAGQTIPCETIEDSFGCPVTQGYFTDGGDSYAHIRFVGPINAASDPSPESAAAEHEIVFAGQPFDGDSFNSYIIRTDNGLGTEVIVAQSFGHMETIDALTYAFDAAELIVPIPALLGAKESGTQTLTADDAFYFSIHRYTQKVKDGESYYKKCFVAARDTAEPGSSLLPCYIDNDSFSAGEDLRMFGTMHLTSDPSSLGIYWPTTDECICFTASGTFLNCDDF